MSGGRARAVGVFSGIAIGDDSSVGGASVEELGVRVRGLMKAGLSLRG